MVIKSSFPMSKKHTAPPQSKKILWGILGLIGILIVGGFFLLNNIQPDTIINYGNQDGQDNLISKIVEAVWGVDANVTLNSPIDNFVSPLFEVEFNATANVTGGATIVNMSLYHNASGVFELNQTVDSFEVLFSEFINDNDGLTLDSSKWFAQSFISNFSGALDSIGIKMKRFSVPGILTLTLFETDGSSKPTGTVLSQNLSVVTTGWSSGSFEWHNITMTNFDLVDGTRYSIVVNLTTVNPNHLLWGSNSAGWSGGLGFRSADSGSTWNAVGSQATTFSVHGIGGSFKTQTFNTTISEPTLWGVQACDSDGDCGFSENRTVSIDIAAPNIIINLPPTIKDFGEAGGNETLNWTITETSLDSIWYNYNGTNVTVYGSANETNFTLLTSPFNLTLWANDSLGNVNSTFVNWSYYLFEDSVTFPSPIYETEEGILEIQVTGQSGLSSISANLWYDGIDHFSIVTNPFGDTYNATNILEIPIIDSDGTSTFFWSFDFKLANGTDLNVNSSTKSQIVNRTYLEPCNATYDIDFINLTTYQAVNPFPEVNATFKVTWGWYINTSSGDIIRNQSFENITEETNTFSFCGSPGDKSFIVDATIEYDGTGFAKNFFYLNGVTLSNVTTNISLYLLNDSAATLTVLRVQDGAQSPLEDYMIEIKAYDVGTGLFNTVAMAETSFAGEDLVYLNWYDTQYKFIITDPDGVEVLNTEAYKVSETPQIFEITTEVTYEFDKFEDIIYSLTFDNSTNIFTLTYTKPTDVDNACLRVIKRNVSVDTEICLTCLTATSATIICDISSSGNGTYIAAFYGTGSLKLIDAISVMIDIQNEIFDALGNLDATAIAIVFAGIVMVMFFISPVMGIVGALLGMVGAVSLGFQPLEGNFYFVYIGIILMGGTIAWLIKK